MAHLHHTEGFTRTDDAVTLARDSKRHLAFGLDGVHHHLGVSLVRMEGEIVMKALLRRFPCSRLAGAPESLRWLRRLFLRGVRGAAARPVGIFLWAHFAEDAPVRKIGVGALAAQGTQKLVLSTLTGSAFSPFDPCRLQ